MDNFSARSRNESVSSDASDIDLDDIAKMIDPLDDLEENLFSNKAKQTSKKNSQASSLKKATDIKKMAITSEGKSAYGKDAEEMEILTSMSSNNGQQININFGDNTFGGLLKSQQSEKQAGMSGAEAYKDEEGKHSILKKAKAPDLKTSDDYEDLKTGLWSGDDLWSLGRNNEKLKQTAGNSHAISPVKSHKETGPHSLNSPTRSPESFSTGNQGFRQRRRSVKPEITASGNKKPGKFDWLGLLDSSDDEKQPSLKSNGQGASLNSADGLKEESDGIPTRNTASKNDLIGNSHYNIEEISKVSKVSLELSSRVEPNISQNTALIKDSMVEDMHNIVPKMKMETTGIAVQQDPSSLLPTGKDVSEVFKDTIQTKVRSRKKNETNSYNSIAKGKSSLMEDFSGSLNKNIESLKEPERETQNDKSSISKRGSISEENEASSAHAYAPTFIADQSEGSGRRRRRNEGGEVSGKGKETFSGMFDPLGLFLMDDKDKIEVKESENKSLPEWLTGSKKASKVEDQSSSSVGKQQESMNDMESKRDITIDKKLEYTKTVEITTKALSGSRESPEKLSGSEEANLAALNEGLIDAHGPRNNANTAADISPVGGLSLQSKESSEEDHISQEKSVIKISKGEKVYKVSSADEKSRSMIGSDSDEQLKQNNLERRKSIKKSLLKKKKLHKGKENYRSEDEGVKTQVFSSSVKFAEKEKSYLRRIRDLEEKTLHLEYLEDELGQMNHLKGEVEHLRAVIHVLELEKSATESLVTSLQERHLEQIQRLEEVYRNEVKTLKDALSREEKRGAEEVGRLAEDHRKTIDRLMEANIRMEEEFRNRMSEARRDWSRDVEAMRLAYQQSSNAAITNASLAVLTGHGVGALEFKDKIEFSKRDDSSSKSLSQCPEEVKGLSQTVERVETILMQTLEAITPKVKDQKSKPVVDNAIEERNQQKLGKIHKSVRERKRAFYKVVSPRVRRRFVHNMKGRMQKRRVADAECMGENLESDSSQQLDEASIRDSDIGSHALDGKKKNVRKFSEDVCQYCNRCQHCRKKSSSPVNDKEWQKSDKEGKNIHEYIKDSLREKLERDYGNDEKNIRKSNESFWLKKIRERKNLLPASARTAIDDDYFSTVQAPRQPGVSI